MTDRDPNIIYSGLGGVVTEQGITVELAIHRLEDRPGWAMGVVNERGTSTVWNGLFDSDDAAFAEFRRTVDEEGMKAFWATATSSPSDAERLPRAGWLATRSLLFRRSCGGLGARSADTSPILSAYLR